MQHTNRSQDIALDSDKYRQSNPDKAETTDLDVLLDVLSNERRRHAIRALEAGPLAIKELSERVAARETGIDRQHLTSEQTKRAYIALYQHHLNALETAGVVTRDRDRVEPGPEFDRTVSVFDAVVRAVRGDREPNRTIGERLAGVFS